jgi:hypothetical protein
VTDKSRFVVYLDFLGTKGRYATPELVVRGRELLEQALGRCVLPCLDADDMRLYVFSDTAIITAPRLIALLGPLADLCGHFLELGPGSPLHRMNLWVRAAISHGRELNVDWLKNSERVRTIPFLDTSLPIAYGLESLRSGSRVFVDPSIRTEAYGESARWFFRWSQITGIGDRLADVGEFLWPGYRPEQAARLCKLIARLSGTWSEVLEQKEWDPEDYKKAVLHIDETIKLLIRASTVCAAPADARPTMLSLLPDEAKGCNNLRFRWGMWFQALRCLVEQGQFDDACRNDIESAFVRLRAILQAGDFWEHFTSELKEPDYRPFRDGLAMLGLHQEG